MDPARALIARAVRIVRVRGESMAPALREGDRVLAIRPGWWRPVRRGDIVVGHVPGEDRTWLFVKRVHALGGEVARVPRDRLAEGTPVEHLGGTIDGPDAAWAVPPGHVFVKGDAGSTADSASWGPIPLSELVGVVVRRLSSRSPGA
jgi:signal peptidase I